MKLSPFSKKQEDQQQEYYEDRLVVIESDSTVCEIYDNVTIDEDSLNASGARDLKVPKADCIVKVSETGRVWIYNAPEQHVANTERLAALERSMVLKQLTMYKPEDPQNPNSDLRFWAVVGICIVLSFVSIF